jgi:ribonuclease BN (tRNA processing enzyme)
MMRVRVLGSCGGWPAAGRACSGFLVEAAGTRLWLDAGPGTLAELLRHAALDEVDALYLSHLDPDHCGDVGVVRNAIAYGGGRRLTVLGPPGWGEWLAGAVPGADATRAAFSIRDIEPGRAVPMGALTLHALPVHHGPPTFGCRVESPEGVLAYSADSGPCAELEELARDADAFLCESYRSRPGDPPSPDVMQPTQAGAIATAAGARRLLLTHLHPAADPARAVAAARTTFAGPVDHASQGQVYEVP